VDARCKGPGSCVPSPPVLPCVKFRGGMRRGDVDEGPKLPIPSPPHGPGAGPTLERRTLFAWASPAMEANATDALVESCSCRKHLQRVNGHEARRTAQPVTHMVRFVHSGSVREDECVGAVCAAVGSRLGCSASERSRHRHASCISPIHVQTAQSHTATPKKPACRSHTTLAAMPQQNNERKSARPARSSTATLRYLDLGLAHAPTQHCLSKSEG
jgi:hypothetical protein